MPSTENFVKINVTVLGRTFCVTEWRILEILKKPSSVSCHRKWGNFVVKGSQAGSGVHWECLHCLPTTIEHRVLGYIGCLDHWGFYKYQILNYNIFLIENTLSMKVLTISISSVSPPHRRKSIDVVEKRLLLIGFPLSFNKILKLINKLLNVFLSPLVDIFESLFKFNWMTYQAVDILWCFKAHDGPRR